MMPLMQTLLRVLTLLAWQFGSMQVLASTENNVVLNLSSLVTPEEASLLTINSTRLSEELFGTFTINYDDVSPDNLAVQNNPVYIPPDSPSLINSSYPANSINPPRNFSASYSIPRTVKFLTIGGLFGLTNGTTGIFDKPGIQFAESFKSAILDVNNNPDILPNTTVLYQIMDTGRDPKDALNAAYLLIQQNVTSFVGLRDISEVISIQPLLTNSNISVTSGAALSTFLSNSRNYPTFYRTVPDDYYIATALVAMMVRFNWTLVAPLYTDDDIGSSGNSAFTKAAAAANISTNCQRTIVTGSLSGVDTFSSCVTASDANVVVLWMDPVNAANCISVIGNADGNGDVYFIAPAEWATMDHFALFSRGRFNTSVLKGSIGAIPRTGSDQLFRNYYSQLTPATNSYPAFLQFWQDQFRCTLSGSPFVPQYFHNQGVDNITMLSDGSIIVPSLTVTVTSNLSLNTPPGSKANISYDETTNETTVNLTISDPFAPFAVPIQPVCPADVRDRPLNISCRCTGNESLATDEDIDYRVNYVYDATYAVILAFDQILNKCTRISDPYLCDNEFINSSILLGALAQTNFEGRTGHVAWVGHDRKYGIVDYYQFDSVGGKRQIGYYNIDGEFIFSNLLEFRTPYLPISSIIPDVINTSDPIAIVVIALSIALIIASVAFMVYFTMKRDTKVVAKSTWTFLFIFHVGIVLVSLCLIVWSFDQTQFTCIIKIFLGLIGYSLVLGVFVAKIFRSFQVLNNLPVSSRYISAKTLILFSGGLSLVNIVLLVLLDFLTGSPNAVVVPSTTDKLYSYVQCRIPDQSYQTIMTVIIFVINGLLTVVTAILAIYTRKVESPFGENRFIAFALYDFVVVLGVLIPIYYTGNDGFGSASRQYILRSLVTLFVTIFTLCVISIPKVVSIVKTSSEEDSTFGSEDSSSSTGGMDGSSTGGGLYTPMTGSTGRPMASQDSSTHGPSSGQNTGSGYDSTGATSGSTLPQSSVTATETEAEDATTTDAGGMGEQYTDGSSGDEEEEEEEEEDGDDGSTAASTIGATTGTATSASEGTSRHSSNSRSKSTATATSVITELETEDTADGGLDPDYNMEEAGGVLADSDLDSPLVERQRPLSPVILDPAHDDYVAPPSSKKGPSDHSAV